MPRYRYVIVSQSKPGREADFKRWYAERHMADVRRHPAVLAAELHEVVFQKDYGLDPPAYCLMTTYEIDSDDPSATLEDIRSRSGSAEMPETDAIDKDGMLQVVGRLIASID